MFVNTVGLPDHLHLERGTVFGDKYQPKWVRSNINALSQFDLTGKDATAPVVESIQFRLQDDDNRGANWQNPPPRGDAFGGQETLRTSARYFSRTVTIGGGDQPVHVGRYATAANQNGKQVSRGGPNKLANANIDFVVNAYDLFGTGTTKLNPQTMRVSIAARGEGRPAVDALAFDFGRLPETTATGVFISGETTRTLYENDATHDSKLVGPFFYIPTNTPNTSRVEYDTDLTKLDRGKFWNSDTAGAWNSKDSKDAQRNATARFPDGVYDVTVTVTDYAGNTGRRTAPVLVQNWERTVSVSSGTYEPGQVIEVTGGEGYLSRQGQRLNLVAVPVTGDTPPNGLRLNTGTSLGTLRTDDRNNAKVGDLRGNLKAATFANPLPNGKYWLMVDYNGDGEFTRELDGYTAISVVQPPLPFAGRQAHALTPGGTSDGLPYPLEDHSAKVTFSTEGTWYGHQTVLLETPGVGTLTTDGASNFEFSVTSAEYETFTYVIIPYQLQWGDQSSNVGQVAIYKSSTDFDVYAFLAGDSDSSAARAAAPAGGAAGPQPPGGRIAPPQAEKQPADGSDDRSEAASELDLHGVATDWLDGSEPTPPAAAAPPTELRQRPAPPPWDRNEPDAGTGPGEEPITEPVLG